MACHLAQAAGEGSGAGAVRKSRKVSPAAQTTRQAPPYAALANALFFWLISGREGFLPRAGHGPIAALVQSATDLANHACCSFRAHAILFERRGKVPGET